MYLINYAFDNKQFLIIRYTFGKFGSTRGKKLTEMFINQTEKTKAEK